MMYSVKEIAALEKVSTRLVYDWIKLGYLLTDRMPTIKGQGRHIITDKQLQDFRELYKKGK